MANDLLQNLPALKPGWSWVKLGDVAKSFKGKKPRNLSTERNEVFFTPYVDIKAFEKKLIDNYTDGINCTLCEPEDVLVVWDGARCGLVGRGIKGAIGSTLAKIKSESHLNSFLFYFLKYHYKLINTNPKGVGIPHIEPNLFWGLNIPLPPLSEQKKIVDKIEEFFSSLDSGVASLKKAKEQIRLYRQSVLAAAFSGRLTRKDDISSRDVIFSSKAAEPKPEYSNQLPDGWKWVKLGEVAELITKGASPRWQGFEYIYDKSQTLFITSENVRENFLDLSRPKYLEDTINEKLKRSILKKGDVLFNLVGASIGRASVFNFEKKANINQAVALIRLTEKLNNKFLSFYLNSENAKRYYMNEVVDFARANLSLTDTKNIPVPIPPNLKQQLQIVEEIEKRFSEADNLEKAIDDSLAKAETLRQSILKKAFEGRLV